MLYGQEKEMIEIFIPVLWICVNANCEFMQSEGYFRTEEKCLASLELHKIYMTNLITQAGGKVTVLEGTCVDAKIKTITERSV